MVDAIARESQIALTKPHQPSLFKTFQRHPMPCKPFDYLIYELHQLPTQVSLPLFDVLYLWISSIKSPPKQRKTTIALQAPSIDCVDDPTPPRTFMKLPVPLPRMETQPDCYFCPRTTVIEEAIFLNWFAVMRHQLHSFALIFRNGMRGIFLAGKACIISLSVSWEAIFWRLNSELEISKFHC
jgi:hypothetical protein